MKKLLILTTCVLTLIFSLFLTSCEDDENTCKDACKNLVRLNEVPSEFASEATAECTAECKGGDPPQSEIDCVTDANSLAQLEECFYDDDDDDDDDFECEDGSDTIPDEWVCDGDDDCDDASDEDDC